VTTWWWHGDGMERNGFLN